MADHDSTLEYLIGLARSNSTVSASGIERYTRDNVLQYLILLLRASGTAPVTPIRPTPPARPAGSVIQLLIDAGRTVSADTLTEWIDQASGYVFVSAPDTPLNVTPLQYQQFDGQNASDNTFRMHAPGASPFTPQGGRTFLHVGNIADAGGLLDPVFNAGVVAPSSALVIGQGTYYGNGIDAPNVTAPEVFDGTLVLYMAIVTPDGTLNAELFMNGWPIVYPNVGVPAPTGLCQADGAATALEILHLSDAGGGAFFYDGDFEEFIAWNERLNPAQILAANGAEIIDRFEVAGVRGYISDCEAPIPLCLTTSQLAHQPLSVTRLYTTSTTFDVYTQNSTGAATIGNLPIIDVFIDDGFGNMVYDQSVTLAAGVTPFPPIPFTLTSARLDGTPHIVELWEGTYAQGFGALGLSASQISRIQDPTGNTVMYPSAQGANVLACFCDSIGISLNCTDNYLGWFARLRWMSPKQWNGRVAFYGASGRSLFTDFLIDPTGADCIARLVAIASNRTPGGVGLIVIQAGTNDYGGNGGLPGGITPGWPDVTTYGNFLGTVIDGVHAADASLLILIIAPIARANENLPNIASGTPFTLPELRAEQEAVAAAGGRPSFVNWVDGSLPFMGQPTVTPADLPDGTHPDDAASANLLNPWLALVLATLYPAAV
jgi:lysophospholipase L1-like esterase